VLGMKKKPTPLIAGTVMKSVVRLHVTSAI
jgi:hypothetical protein